MQRGGKGSSGRNNSTRDDKRRGPLAFPGPGEESRGTRGKHPGLAGEAVGPQPLACLLPGMPAHSPLQLCLATSPDPHPRHLLRASALGPKVAGHSRESRVLPPSLPSLLSFIIKFISYVCT